MIKNILIDTNILFKDHNLTGNDLKKLTKIANLYKVNICIPQIVIDELVGQYRNLFKDSIVSLTKSYKNVQMILLDKKSNQIEFYKHIENLEKRAEQYENNLLKFIEKHDIKVLPYPRIGHDIVVKDMYLAKHPFLKKDMEKGYKDYLLSITARTVETKRNKVVIYTRNIKDFSSSATIKKGELIPLHSDFKARSCYVSDNLSDIVLSLLSQNKKLKKLELDDSNLEFLIDEFAKVITTDIMFTSETYGEQMFEPEIRQETLVSKPVGLNIEVDKEFELFHLNGQLEISFTCNFELNSYEYDIYDTTFIFHDLVTKFLLSKGVDIASDEEWFFKFYDIEFHRVFDISYEIYDYKTPKDIKNFEEFSLTAYPV